MPSLTEWFTQEKQVYFSPNGKQLWFNYVVRNQQYQIVMTIQFPSLKQ